MINSIKMNKVILMSNLIRIRASDARHRPRRGVHQHDHYEILIIKDGFGTHLVDFDEYAVKPNQVYFMRPGQMHEFTPSKGAVFYFVAFDESEVMLTAPTALKTFQFFQSFHCNGPVVLDEVDSIIGQMQDIQYELENPNSMQMQLLSGLLTVFLIKLQRKFKTFRQVDFNEENSLVTQFNLLIDGSDDFRFVKDYAKQLHVSTTYLNDSVKKVTGFPASFWINKKQVIRSKQLLSNLDLNFKCISAQLGFTDPTHFARFFKQHTNQTPSDYRKTIKW